MAAEDHLQPLQFSPPWQDHPERALGHGAVAHGPACSGPGCKAKRTRGSPFCSRCKSMAGAEFVPTEPGWNPATYTGPTRRFSKSSVDLPANWE